MKNLEELEIKRELLSEEEKEKCIQNIKVLDRNDSPDPDLICLICNFFPHNPVVCNGCKFKACQKCFDEHKLINKNDKCIMCSNGVPQININFNIIRDNL